MISQVLSLIFMFIAMGALANAAERGSDVPQPAESAVSPRFILLQGGLGLLASNQGYFQERLGIGIGTYFGDEKRYSVELVFLKQFSNESLPSNDPYPGGIQRLSLIPYLGYGIVPERLIFKAGIGLSDLAGENPGVTFKVKPTFAAGLRFRPAVESSPFEWALELAWEHTGQATSGVNTHSDVFHVFSPNRARVADSVIPLQNSYSLNVILFFGR